MDEVRYGIPIPKSGSGRKSKYKFEEMKVGGYRFYACDNYDQVESIRQSAYSHARRYGVKFETRKMKGGIGCWRTE